MSYKDQFTPWVVGGIALQNDVIKSTEMIDMFKSCHEANQAISRIIKNTYKSKDRL